MMSKNIKISVPVGKAKFTFADEDGDIFSSFYLNPADTTVVGRCAEVAEWMEKLSIPTPDNAEKLLDFNKSVEDKICYLLGYDAQESVFGVVPATAVLEDGSMFAAEILKAIVTAVRDEMQIRTGKMDKAAEKYLAEYE